MSVCVSFMVIFFPIVFIPFGFIQAVGTYDDAVRILSLDPDDCLQIIARQV